MGRIWRLSITIFAIILIDQFTKGYIQTNFHLGETIPVIDGLFNFTYVRNPGAAFGFLAAAPDYIRRPLFLGIPVVACLWLIYLIWKIRYGSLLLSVAYSLILAGALGNLIDRFTLGYVVDFFDFYFKASHFPAFNIADSSITIAAFLLIVDLFLSKKIRKLDENNEVTEK